MKRLLGGVVFALGVALGASVLPQLGRERAASAEPAPAQRPAPGAAKAKESLVLYQGGAAWEEVPGDGAAEGGKDVKDLGLIVKGVSRVRFRGKVYAVDREGLYRFMVMPQSVQNVISLRDGKSLVPLLKALSALQVHGNRHDVAPDQVGKLREKLRSEPWVSITCGTVSYLFAAILKDEGYKTRQVYALAPEELHNGYDDGHRIFEVFWPAADKWVLVDADMGLLFKDGGAFLDADEFGKRVKDGKKPEFFPLGQKAAVLDPFFPSATGYNYALEFRWRWGTEEGKWRWYRRVFQKWGRF